jgi:PBP1b-binding outer membrane lipoprotein LpoB
MKKLYPFVFLVVLLTSCLGYKELPVEYDYSYKGNFKKYRTFDIMKPAGLADSTMTNSIIEKSIVAYEVSRVSSIQ